MISFLLFNFYYYLISFLLQSKNCLQSYKVSPNAFERMSRELEGKITIKTLS